MGLACQRGSQLVLWKRSTHDSSHILAMLHVLSRQPWVQCRVHAQNAAQDESPTCPSYVYCWTPRLSAMRRDSGHSHRSSSALYSPDPSWTSRLRNGRGFASSRERVGTKNLVTASMKPTSAVIVGRCSLTRSAWLTSTGLVSNSMVRSEAEPDPSALSLLGAPEMIDLHNDDAVYLLEDCASRRTSPSCKTAKSTATVENEQVILGKAISIWKPTQSLLRHLFPALFVRNGTKLPWYH